MERNDSQSESELTEDINIAHLHLTHVKYTFTPSPQLHPNLFIFCRFLVKNPLVRRLPCLS